VMCFPRPLLPPSAALLAINIALHNPGSVSARLDPLTYSIGPFLFNIISVSLQFPERGIVIVLIITSYVFSLLASRKINNRMPLLYCVSNFCSTVISDNCGLTLPSNIYFVKINISVLRYYLVPMLQNSPFSSLINFLLEIFT